LELVLAGRLDQQDGRLVAPGTEATGDELLDFVLAEIRGQQRPRKLKWWVNRLGSGGWGDAPVRRRLIDKLTRDGVLERAEERVLGLVPVTRHPPRDPALPDRERAAVREVLVAGREPDAALAALIALEACAAWSTPAWPARSGRPPAPGPGRSPRAARSAGRSASSRTR
jgi:Golgi phosphoprotein 3 GPP34